VGFWNIGGTIQMVNAILAGMAEQGIDLMLPPFPEAPPVAFAMKASGNEVRKELVIPFGTLKAVSMYAVQLQALMFGMPMEM
jgi:hypothetical protein